jgi:hypothetical protein
MLTPKASSPDRTRVAHAPASGLGQRQEALKRFVEQRRFLKIEDVAGFWEIMLMAAMWP